MHVWDCEWEEKRKREGKIRWKNFYKHIISLFKLEKPKYLNVFANIRVFYAIVKDNNLEY